MRVYLINIICFLFFLSFIIDGKNVRLGPLKKEYIPHYVKWFNDPEMLQYLMMIRPMTLENEEQWYENAIKKQNRYILQFFLLMKIKNI